jgi:hypothetical protein
MIFGEQHRSFGEQQGSFGEQHGSFGEQHGSLSSSLHNTLSYKLRFKNTCNWAGFFPTSSVFPYQLNSTTTPYSIS